VSLRALRGDVLHCLRDPGLDGDAAAIEFLADAVLVLRDGIVDALGPATELLPTLGPDVVLDDWRGHLIVPGFVDAHAHFAQVDVVASHGTQLLEWLERYTFPEEEKFARRSHAEGAATFFLDELLRHGTTTASVFGTVHADATDAFFATAAQRGVRMLAGKCLMDRHAPATLCDTAESGARDSRELIERWHGYERLRYSLTPRFAVTSSDAQHESLRELARTYTTVHLQGHVAENRAEVAWVARLFPHDRSYLAVYDRYGLLRERAIYAHCIWLDAQDRARLAATGTAAAFCPTSNLFMGSGLFDLHAALEAGVRVGLATDIGGGTSYSMLRTLAAAYEVQQLLGVSLSPAYALYLATLGGARSLYLDPYIGNFAHGKEADIAVLDPAPTPVLGRRTALRGDPLDRFFALAMLGDDRAIAATYVMGSPVHRRASLAPLR
jgi:guanine deaminase